ncbi:MAG: hotdog fold thioesterase [Bacteroidota bacterium]
MPDLPNPAGGLAALLGIELVEAGPERVVATMPVTPDHHQPMGYLHGGASVAFAETIVSVGAFLGAPKGHTAFGMEINANHLRSKQEGLLTGVGTPVHQGRTSQVWQVEIRDEDEKLICVSRCTVAITPLRTG